MLAVRIPQGCAEGAIKRLCRTALMLDPAVAGTWNFMNCRLDRLAKAALPVIWQQLSAPRDIAVTLETDAKNNQGRKCHVQPQNRIVARCRQHRRRAPIGFCPASASEGRAICKCGG